MIYCAFFKRKFSEEACIARLKQGICLCNMKREADKTNMKRNNRGKDKIVIDMTLVKKFQAEGKSIPNIAKLFGVDKNTIRARIKENEEGGIKA